MTRWILGTGAAVAMMLLPFALMADPPGEGERGPRGKKGFGPPIAKLTEALSLTPDQVTQIEGLKAELKPAIKALKEEMKSARAEMDALWTAQPFDRAAIDAKKAELDALHAQMGNLRLDMRAGIMGVLDAEQQAKFLEMKPNKRKRKAKKRSRRGARSRGGDTL